jgi:hypothetical protein
MGGACSMHWVDEKCMPFKVLDGLGERGRIIL